MTGRRSRERHLLSNSCCSRFLSHACMLLQPSARGDQEKRVKSQQKGSFMDAFTVWTMHLIEACNPHHATGNKSQLP